MSRPRVGVVLAGCGVYDGAEVHEAVLTLLALDRAGARAICAAPNAPQLHVINHLTGEVTGESRNVLVESARIARGNVADVAEVSGADLDALILPGGFGAAKNLCDFAVKGAACSVHPEVARLVREVHAQGKPIGAICIAPALIASVLGDERPRLTIGNDPGTAAAIEGMGGRHVACGTDGTVVDLELRIVTTPAYMLAGCIAETAVGIEKLVGEVLSMVDDPVPAVRA
jgi:enhancing lycopene biosynthesis protein 2